MTPPPQNNSLFETGHLLGDLRRRTVRGATVTLTAQGVRFALTLSSTMILARLLTPSDFGLVSMATVLTSFLNLFSGLGLSLATVQRHTVFRDQVSTLFWVNAAVSSFLALLLAVLAVPVAWFYREPRLTAITAVLALSILFGGLGTQHRALLARQMRFLAAAAANLIGLTVGILVAVLLASRGAGYWALVLMTVTTEFVGTVAVWLCAGWWPGPPRRGTGVRSMVAFGGYLSAFQLVNYVGRNLDTVLIGRFWGSTQLGWYSRAYALMLLPLNQLARPVGSVAVSALSRLQHDHARFRAYYLRGVSSLSLVTTPLVIFLLVYAKDVVYIVLGRQWGESVIVFRLLGLAALLQPLMSTTGWLHTAVGRTDRLFKQGLFMSVCLVLGFLVGLPYGPQGVALSYSIAFGGLTLPCLIYASRGTPVGATDIVTTVSGPWLVALTSAGATWLVAARWLGDMSSPFSIACCVSTFLFLYAAQAAMFLDAWRDCKDMFRDLTGPPRGAL